jgi:hypothetical protein
MQESDLGFRFRPGRHAVQRCRDSLHQHRQAARPNRIAGRTGRGADRLELDPPKTPGFPHDVDTVPSLYPRSSREACGGENSLRSVLQCRGRGSADGPKGLVAKLQGRNGRPGVSDRAKLKARIAALLAKTVANGCTEAEALAAAAKVADLLDRHALAMSDVEIRQSPCERVAFASRHKKRVPLDGCIGAIAAFCDCRAWREKGAEGGVVHVFFGLPEDAGAARDLAEMVDGAVRAELGRYKTSRAYAAFDTRDRHMVNASFVLGMVGGIADRLDALKAQRDARHRGTGRDLAVVKTSAVDEAFAGLGLVMVEGQGGPRRFIAEGAYEAGEAAGAELTIGWRP